MIFLVLSCFFYALPNALYIPSILFYFPFYFSKIFSYDKKLNLLIFIAAISLLFSVIINLEDIRAFTLLKSFIISILYPISFALGIYLRNKFNNYKFLNKFILYSFLVLIFIQTSNLFFYEPSAAARQYFGSFLLFYFILINYSLTRNFKRIIVLFMIIMSLRILSMGSLSFLVIILFSLVLTIFFITTKIICSLTLKINKSYLKLIFLSLFLISIFFIAIYQFNIIALRRLNALNAIIDFLGSFDLDLIMTISGGRFLATFSGFEEFFNSPFDLSNILLDKPSISADSPFFDNLLSYSGLGEEYLTSKRPTSLVSWLLFNQRILSLPIISHIIFYFFKLTKLIFKEKDIKFVTFYSSTFSYILLVGFIASQPSLCIPWILLGFCSNSDKKRN